MGLERHVEAAHGRRVAWHAPPQRHTHQLRERSGLVSKRVVDRAPRLALREPERRQREHGITPPILARHYRRLVWSDRFSTWRFASAAASFVLTTLSPDPSMRTWPA